MRAYIKINPADNVAVAIEDLKEGFKVDEFDLDLKEDIKSGHKFALKDIKEGEEVIKYGMPIGRASKNIGKGAWAHTHNLKTGLKKEETYSYEKSKIGLLPKVNQNLTFKGYLREDGRVGIRNEIWIIPTVGCINKLCENIKKISEKRYPDMTFQVLNHTHGCSQLGDDLETTRKILAGLASNPNAGGVLIVSLGCENNKLSDFKEYLGPISEERIKFMVAQEVDDEYEEALNLVDSLVRYGRASKKEDFPLSKLTIGFKCGGSDGFSGITANPLCGHIADYLVASSGTCLLTEVPEMFGAEKILMSRAKDYETFEKIVKLINNFKDYFTSYGQEVYENPSPGNKEGGITSLEDKSLGCIQKGGKSQIVDVLDFGQRPKVEGLNLLNGPGNDQVSATNLVASGCNLIIFTTGRGTPFGSVVPTIKVSTNSKIYEKKKNRIDFDAGKILNEDISFEDLRDEFLSYIIRVCSGEETKNEKYDFREIAIFKNGVIL